MSYRLIVIRNNGSGSRYFARLRDSSGVSVDDTFVETLWGARRWARRVARSQGHPKRVVREYEIKP